MSNWLASALQTVRERSLDAYEFVRRDLTEFTTTVRTDTETFVNRIKPDEISDLSLNRLVSTITGQEASKNDDEQNVQNSASFDRIKDLLTKFQNDESTYLNDPNPIEPYNEWKQTSSFSVESRKGEIAQLLIDAPQVRTFYATFVPGQTTHVDFWSRYYYRVYQLEQEEERRNELRKRASRMCEENQRSDTNSAADWDEPDEIIEEEKPTEIVDETKKNTEEIQTTEDEDNRGETTSLEQKETDSADSWEREFDENESSSEKDQQKQNTEVKQDEEETIEPPMKDSSKTGSTEKKPDGELEDDWESWS